MMELADFRDGSDTCVSLCRNGSTFKTGDSMGFVYTLSAGESGATRTEGEAVGEESITAIASSPNGTGYAVANKCTMSIWSDDLKEEKMSLAVRRTLDITHMAYDKGGNHVFVASREPDVLVYNVLTNEVDFKVSTKSAGVRHFSLSSVGDAMATLDENGTVTINGLVVTEGADGVRSFTGSDCLKTIGDVVSKEAARAYDQYGCSTSWHPQASTLAVPSMDGNLMLFTRSALHGNEWDEQYLVASGDAVCRHKNAAVLVEFSPNGKYIASADTTGDVVIWDVATESAIAMHHCGQPLCDVAWGNQAGDNYILVVSANGSAVVREVVPDGFISPTMQVEAGSAEVTATQIDTEMEMQLDDVRDEGKEGEEGKKRGEDEKEGDESSSNKTKRGTWSSFEGSSFTSGNGEGGADEPQGALPGDLELSDADEDDAATSIEALKASVLGTSAQAQDEDIAPENFDDADANGANADAEGGAENAEGEAVPTAPVVMLQKAFQPSATLADEKKRRFLVWNAYGHVLSRDDRMAKRIDMVLLADANGRRREENFTDNYGFTKGCLGPQGAAFADDRGQSTYFAAGISAEERAEDDHKGATLFYYAFPGFQTNETFTTNLPVGEGVDAVAVGAGWLAVATTRGLLRVFSTTGLQLHISWLKGPMVTMVGTGMQLALFYHGAAPCNESFNVHVDVLEFGPETCFRMIAHSPVPLSPSSKVDWAGFCPNSNILSVCDSEGVLSVLLKSCGWQWVPVMDCQAVRKNHDDYYWPVCIVDGCFEYALLKGVSKPSVFPLPMTASKEFSVPVALTVGPKATQDADSDRCRALVWETAQATHTESIKAELDPLMVLPEGYSLLDLEERVAAQATVADRAVLKLLQEACRVQKDALCFDLAKRLRTEKACAAAIKVANHFGKPALAFALEDTLRYKQQMATAMREDEEEAVAAMNVADSRALGATTYATTDSPSPAGFGKSAAPRSAAASESSGDSAVVTPGLSSGSRGRSVHFSDDAQKRRFSADGDLVDAENMENREAMAALSSSPGSDKRQPNKFARALNNAAAGTSSPGSGRKSIFSPKRERPAVASPSPIKTPRLARESSYAAEARSNMKQRMSNDGYI